MSGKSKDFFQVATLFFIAAAVCVVGLVSGSASIPIDELFSGQGAGSSILFLRASRTFCAFTAGSGLALAGLAFQAVFRNPLAEPFTLGISGGASVGAVVAFATGFFALSPFVVPAAAFAGALIVLSLVLLPACRVRGGGSNVEHLLLSGVIAGAVCGSIIMFLVSVSDESALAGSLWWMLGDCQGSDVFLTAFSFVCVLILAVVLAFDGGKINALLAGDEFAWSAGVSPRRLVVKLVFFASLASASTVAMAGIIAFCGLMVPHVVRRIYGCDYRRIVLKTFLAGGSFLVICDVLSRVLISPVEIPVGVVTSFAGGIFFLYVLNGRKKHVA